MPLNRLRFLLALLFLGGFVFSSCNDKSSSDTAPQSKLEDPNQPPIGTIDNHCAMAGQACVSTVDCCGIGVCSGTENGTTGFCSSLSCIQPNEHCSSTADCCQGICVTPNVGPGVCH